ncbi:MAG: delta-lactam-biosynthetic de-N-acetylase [Hyphomonadaceae bacterium]|nr:delta-lactam-biosynthetic de-N-acetylase [Clostridia bacterium]
MPTASPTSVPLKSSPIVTTGLTNKKLGFYFLPQDNHQPSKVDATLEKLYNQYNAIYIHHTTQKVIYLTFDEGYENGYTPSILDTLKANHVKAAFFITGEFIKTQPNLVKRMVAEGHTIGNHSVTHPSMPEITDDSKLQAEILGVERTFHDMFGKKMTYFRAPRGEYSERTLAITKSLGYRSVFWSFAYADWDTKAQKGADNAYNVVMNRLHPGEVLLLHAVSKDNTEALDRIIKAVQARGYVFKTLDEM